MCFLSINRRNLMKLLVYYEDLNYELIEQKAAYEVQSLRFQPSLCSLIWGFFSQIQCWTTLEVKLGYGWDCHSLPFLRLSNSSSTSFGFWLGGKLLTEEKCMKKLSINRSNRRWSRNQRLKSIPDHLWCIYPTDPNSPILLIFGDKNIKNLFHSSST